MIINVDGEKKKRGRKKKIIEEINKNKDNDKFSLISEKEKSRMNKFGIIGYETIVEIFKNIIKTKNIPNLTIYGKSGSGKSYLVNWLLMSLFKNNIRERVLYLSLNDERGISTMREKIKAFSNIQVKLNKDLPPVKVIVFDQAEYLSLDAQNALRRIIELSNHISRFIFITRNTRSIIDPILSRCLQLNLNVESVKNRYKDYLKYFPNINKDIIENICKTNNNFGREISLLENISNYGIEMEKNINEDAINDIVNILFDKKLCIKKLINLCNKNLSNINIITAIHQIYNVLRLRIDKDIISNIGRLFLEFEIDGNISGGENIYLLNLFLQVHKKIHNL